MLPFLYAFLPFSLVSHTRPGMTLSALQLCNMEIEILSDLSGKRQIYQNTNQLHAPATFSLACFNCKLREVKSAVHQPHCHL